MVNIDLRLCKIRCNILNVEWFLVQICIDVYGYLSHDASLTRTSSNTIAVKPMALSAMAVELYFKKPVS